METEALQRYLESVPEEKTSRQVSAGIVTEVMWTKMEHRLPEVEKAFLKFLTSVKDDCLTDESWSLFYEFIFLSYKSENIGSRLSICEFADRLRLTGVKEVGFFSGLYGAGIQIIEFIDVKLNKLRI